MAIYCVLYALDDDVFFWGGGVSIFNLWPRVVEVRNKNSGQESTACSNPGPTKFPEREGSLEVTVFLDC